MYIEPNSTVKLLKGVPLDTSYRNTVVWDNLTAQVNGFSAFTKHTLSKQSYQRINKGVFRCEKSANACYDCNYMMFQNTAYGNKWFYAFINKVEYINDSMCQIVFTLDIIQTWYNEWSFESCFVERETTSTDGMFEHLIAENFSISDYVSRFEHYTSHLCSKVDGDTIGQTLVAIVIASEANIDGTWYKRAPVDIGNIVSCLFYYSFIINDNGLTLLSNFISNYETEGKADAILSIYTVPKYVLKDMQWNNGGRIFTGVEDVTKLYPKVPNVYPTDLDGYVPKNKKLFSSPFCMVELTNNNGSSQLYKPENLSYFDDNSLGFNVTCTFMPNGEIWCTPNTLTADRYTNNSVVSLSNYPQGVVTYDYFNNWWASEKINYIAKTVNNVVNTGFNLSSSKLNSINSISAVPMVDGSTSIGATGNVTSLAKGMGNSYINALKNITSDTIGEFANISQADIIPPSVIGNSSGFNMLTSVKNFDFSCTLRTLRKDVAQQIDDYFTVYGYRVDTLKVPTVRNRPHWTYIKTKGCNIKGSMPADDIATIEDIVDNGITFWRNINEVGNYSLDNSV